MDLPVIQSGKKVGRIDLTDYHVIPNPDFPITWSCCADGDCCTRIGVTLDQEDVKTIEHNTKLSFHKIVDSVMPVRKLKGNPHYLLRRGLNGCQFLEEDGLCGIYPIRPFGCRIYPFQFDFSNLPEIVVRIHPEVCHRVEGQSSGDNQKILMYLAGLLRDKPSMIPEY